MPQHFACGNRKTERGENADKFHQTKFRKQAGKKDDLDSNCEGNNSDRRSDDTCMEAHSAPFANMSKLKQCKWQQKGQQFSEKLN